MLFCWSVAIQYSGRIVQTVALPADKFWRCDDLMNHRLSFKMIIKIATKNIPQFLTVVDIIFLPLCFFLANFFFKRKEMSAFVLLSSKRSGS